MPESKTDEVFDNCEPGYFWVYYNLKTPEELKKALEKGYPVVLMFSAETNEPSKVMLRTFRAMAYAKKDQAVFCRLDINIDKFKDVVQRFRVEALPTFVLIKNGGEQRRVVGIKVGELNTTIKNSI